LDGKIYILQADSKFIIVYSRKLDGYWKPKELKNTNFNRPQDIAACSARKVLCILDQSCIWEVDINHKITVFVKLPQIGVYRTMSAAGKDIVVTSSNTIRTYVCSLIGKPASSKARIPEGLRKSVMKPWHALEIDNGHVIAHIEAAKYHRVSKILQSQRNKAQVEVSTYGKEAGAGIDELSNPVYLAADDGHVFVADHDNQRIVVLDRYKLERRMIIDLPETCYPSRLCYVDEHALLLVGMSNGSVITYKSTRHVLFNHRQIRDS